MKMRIYLVQHGEAFSKEENPVRPLTEKGRRDTRRVAEFLKNKGIRVDTIFHSTKLRAKETAEIFASVLHAELREEKDLEPLADPKIWAEKIENMKEDTMIVGHLPHLSRFVSQLLCQKREDIVKFSPGGLVCLEKDEKWRVLFVMPSWLLDEDTKTTL